MKDIFDLRYLLKFCKYNFFLNFGPNVGFYCIGVILGDMDSGPVFLRKSLDECVYEFEWQTAAACVLSRETGTGCKVYNEDLGKPQAPYKLVALPTEKIPIYIT